MGNSRDNTQHYEPKKVNKKGTFLLTVLQWVIVAIIGAFVFANVKPYELLAKQFFSGISYVVVTNVLLNIPILGAIFRAIAAVFNVGMGFLLWSFFQILELLPLALFGHGAFLDNSIVRSGAKRYGENEKDPWEVKTAKYVGNSLGTETLRFLIILGVAIYVVDFFLCLSVFPLSKVVET